MKNNTYICPYHNKVVEAGKPCQDCEDYFKNTPIENMTLQQILDEYDLYFTDKYHKPVLTLSTFHKLKLRLSAMVNGEGIIEVTMTFNPQMWRDAITKAFNKRQAKLIEKSK